MDEIIYCGKCYRGKFKNYIKYAKYQKCANMYFYAIRSLSSEDLTIYKYKELFEIPLSKDSSLSVYLPQYNPYFQIKMEGTVTLFELYILLDAADCVYYVDMQCDDEDMEKIADKLISEHYLKHGEDV